MTGEPEPKENLRDIAELKRHINNFFEALLALCPSRNYLSQFLSLLPDDYASMYDSFPEFLADRDLRETMRTILGLTYGPIVEIPATSTGKKLQQLINLALEVLSDSSLLNTSSDILKEVRNGAPLIDPAKEWITVKVQAALEDPKWGIIAKGILNILKVPPPPIITMVPESEVESRAETNFARKCLTLQEISSSFPVPPKDLPSILYWLTNHLKILQRMPEVTLEGTPA